MRISDYTLRNLRTFCAIVEHGGFGGAQAMLGSSMSVISTHLKDLEVTLGFTLCQRGRAGFVLTPAGEAVYQEAKTMLGSIEICEANLGAMHKVLTGHLRVGLVDSEADNPELPVYRAIRRFFRREQRVKLSLEIGTPDTLAKALQTGDVHVAIGPFPDRQSNVEYIPIYVETHALYCGADHFLFSLQDEKITRTHMAEHPITVRSYLRQSELAELPGRKIVASVSNMEAQAVLIQSGCFLGFLPIHFAARWVERHEMRRLGGSELEWISQFYIAIRNQSSLPEIVRVFANDLQHELANGSMQENSGPNFQ